MTSLRLEHLQIGWCVSLAALAQRGQPWRPRRFPAGVTLIHHPEHGSVLLDAGYSRAALAALRHGAARVYGTLLPARLPPGDSLPEQLARRGTDPSSITAIIATHLHIDHLSGATELPHAPVWMDPAEITALTSFTGLAALRHGIVPAALPGPARLRPLEYAAAPASLAPFPRARDFFGDGSLWIVPSPGHTDGSVCALARVGEEDGAGGGLVLLGGDLAWSERALREGIDPHPLVRRLTQHDPAEARASRRQWQQWLARHPRAGVVVSHERPVS